MALLPAAGVPLVQAEGSCSTCITYTGYLLLAARAAFCQGQQWRTATAVLFIEGSVIQIATIVIKRNRIDLSQMFTPAKLRRFSCAQETRHETGPLSDSALS